MSAKNLRYNVVINPRYEETLHSWVQAIPQMEAKDLGSPFYVSRNSLYSLESAGIKITLKCFKVPAFPNSWIYTHVRTSKARRSYENSMHLLSLGINTPDPIAYVEEIDARCGTLLRSWYACRTIENCETMRDWELKPDFEILLNRLARWMVMLHDHGVCHHDLSPGNILVDDCDNFYLVDVNRMSFGVYSLRKQISNFKSLHYKREEIERIASLYADARGVKNREKFVKKACREFDAYWNSKRRRSAIKRMLGKKQ